MSRCVLYVSSYNITNIEYYYLYPDIGMPYRRSGSRSAYRRRPRRFGPRRKAVGFLDRKYSTRDIAMGAWKAAKVIRGLVNSEMLHSQAEGSTTVATAGTCTLINGLAQGDQASARTGNSVLMRTIFLRLAFTQHASAVTTFYRCMLVLDTQQISDTAVSVSDVLETSSTISALATASVGRFKVLYNNIFSTSTNDPTHIEEVYKNVYFHTRFNGTGSVDIQKNGVYLIVISDQPTNAPTMKYMWKVGYHDN